MGRRKKNQPAVEQLPSGATARDMGDQAGPGTPQPIEPEKNFETQRESIEDLNPNAIQPFQAIPDYVEPTTSLYPIVVKTPTCITCIEGWSLIEQAKEAGRASVTCHIYHVTYAPKEELAIRKVACRTMPLGGVASYAEKVQNVSKAFQMVKESKEELILFAHGGARRGIVFSSLRDENIRIVLAKRFGKSPATIGKYINHGDWISDEAMQILAQEGADKEYFEAFQEAKMKLVEHMKGQQLSENQILIRVSDDILRIHQLQGKDRTQEIKNLLASLAPAQSPQDVHAVQPGESEPLPPTPNADEAEGVEKTEPALEGTKEVPEGIEEEGGGKNADTKEEPQPPFLHTDPQGDQPFDDDEIRTRGIAICEDLRRYFANREVPLPEGKQLMRSLIGALNRILAAIPEA